MEQLPTSQPIQDVPLPPAMEQPQIEEPTLENSSQHSNKTLNYLVGAVLLGLVLVVAGLVWWRGQASQVVETVPAEKPGQFALTSPYVLVTRYEGKPAISDAEEPTVDDIETNIIAVHPETLEESILLSFPEYRTLQGAVSPDDAYFFLIEQDEPYGIAAEQLVVYSSNGHEMARTTLELEYEGTPYYASFKPCHWSPDSSKIACNASASYNETDSSQPTNVLFVWDWQNSELQKITDIPQDGLGPLLMGSAGWLDNDRYLIVMGGSEFDAPQPDLELPPAEFYSVDTNTGAITSLFSYRYDPLSNTIATVPAQNAVVFNAFARVGDDELIVLPLDTLEPEVIAADELVLALGNLHAVPGTSEILYNTIDPTAFGVLTRYNLATGETVKAEVPGDFWSYFGEFQTVPIQVWGKAQLAPVLFNTETQVQKTLDGSFFGIVE